MAAGSSPASTSAGAKGDLTVENIDIFDYDEDTTL